MPIYAYKCESCGHSKDVLQKISDAPLLDCPSCGAPTFKKQLTAAGFQLKGSGWYATDFRGGTNKAPAAPVTAASGGKTETKTETQTDSKPSESTTTTAKSEAAPAASAGDHAPARAGR